MSGFLRERRGEIETARTTSYTPEQKSDALTMLRGSVVIVRHPYERCRYSGAGNCWCGRDEGSPLHHVVIEPAAGPVAETPEQQR